MVPEAPLEPTDGGLVPVGEGWFVVNARDARWLDGDFGAYTRFEGEARFPMLGINIGVLAPGQPACMYHGEAEQEDFLVLSGECLLLVEGEERKLKAWDFVHCPAWTEHVFVGAGEGPCTILRGRDPDGWGRDLSRLRAGPAAPRPEFRRRHLTRRWPTRMLGPDSDVAYRDGWLPGL